MRKYNFYAFFHLHCLFQDTWGTMADALSNYLWGDNQKLAQPQTQRAADITEQFETLYSRENSSQEDTITSMAVYITTCSRCRSVLLL